MKDRADGVARSGRGTRLREPPAAGDRRVPLKALDQLVRDGDTVALGGSWLSSHPMAAVRQLVRGGRRDLDLVSLTGGLDVDVLVGAGCARSVAFSFVSLGPFGGAPRFRDAVERGAVATDEHTGHGLTVALEASSRCLGFMPFHGPAGTALAARYPTEASPVDGAPVSVAVALTPDVAILHADAATPDGHTLLAASLGIDHLIARASQRVIVTAERIVDSLPASGSRYLSSSEVHHIMDAPWGAHPLAHAPRYAMDWRRLLEYAGAAATADGFDAWLRAHLGVGEAEYLERLDRRRRRRLRGTAA